MNSQPEQPPGDGSARPSAAARLADLFADFDTGLATGLAGAADVAPVQADAAPAKAVPLAAALAVDAAEPPATEAAALDTHGQADAPLPAVLAATPAPPLAPLPTPPLAPSATPRPAPIAKPPRGPRPDPLIEVAKAPHRYTLLHVLRQVDAFHRDKPRLGTARRPVDEPIRLGQAADLAFAPTELSAVNLQDRSGKPRIEVRSFGLFGPNGPLPLHLTAYARERRMHKGDETFGRFADMFHHRLLLLFYRAWAQAQPTASLDRPDADRFADYVGSLIGVGGAAWRQRDAAPDHARLAFAGLLSRQARNADGLAHLLSGYLGMAVRVEQFVGRWMTLPTAERTRIGRRAASRRQSTSQLGVSAVLGQAVFDRQHHFRVHVGPLSLAAFETLLPVGQALPAVQALLKHYVGLELGWDLRLELDRSQVPACRPGRYGRLGWTTWLGMPAAGRPAALNLVPNPLTS